LDYFGIQQFPIKFRHSQADYSYNEETKSIHKGIASLKYLNSNVAKELYDLKDESFETFLDVLMRVKEYTSINSRQLTILIKLDFFSEFGKSKKLLQIYELYDMIYSRKQFKIDKLDELCILESQIEKYAGKKTAKLYKEVDTYGLIMEMMSNIDDKDIGLNERLKAEMEFMGYLTSVYPDVSYNLYFVTGLKTYQSKNKPYLKLYRIQSGTTIDAKITSRTTFSEAPFEEGDIIMVHEMAERPKRKKVDDEWVKTGEFGNVIVSHSNLTNKEVA